MTIPQLQTTPFSPVWWSVCDKYSIFITIRRVYVIFLLKQVQLGGCSLVYNDEFSSTLMEQRTLDAIGVLIISTTAGGGVLGWLRCNVHSEGGKYTSATPRCTCLPPRQHCAEVALGAFTTDSSAMLTRREATPRCTWTWTQRTWAESAKYTTPRCSTYTSVKLHTA